MTQPPEPLHDVLNALEIVVALQLAPQKSPRPDPRARRDGASQADPAGRSDLPEQAAEDNLPGGEIREGEVRSGRVRSIRPFGIFVDLGPDDGLVHVSELSWEAGADPGDLFKLDQIVRVFVLRIDERTGNIRLSIKRADSGPWQDAARGLEVGQWLPAVVEDAIPKGAFVQLFGPVDGYVKAAELVDWKTSDVRGLVQAGDVIPVQIIEIDLEWCRVALSMRRARPAAEADGWQFDDRGLVSHVPDHVQQSLDERRAIAPQFYDAGDGAPADAKYMGDPESGIEEPPPTDRHPSADDAPLEDPRPAAAGDDDPATDADPVDGGEHDVVEIHPARTQRIADEADGRTQQVPDDEDMFAGFEPGTIHDARIVETRPTGLRVDIDGIRGFVHRVEIDGDTPPELFELGREVRVSVLSINRSGRELTLSIRMVRRLNAAAAAMRDEAVVPAVITWVDEDAAYALVPCLGAWTKHESPWPTYPRRKPTMPEKSCTWKR